MGRIENPIDWSIPARGELAALLRTARKEAGVTYQELSERTGLSSATLKRAASGRVLPSEITIERFLTACGGSAQDTTHATALRCDARRQEFGPPGRTVRITLISAPAELGNALWVSTAMPVRLPIGRCRPGQGHTGSPSAAFHASSTGRCSPAAGGR